MEKITVAKIKAKIGFYLSMIVIIMALALTGLLYYWETYPTQILQIKKLPVPVTKPEDIKAGRIILLKFDYCKLADVEGKVEASLVSDRSIVFLPTYLERTPMGCNKVDAPLILPYTVIAQNFHIHYKITYYPNPIRTIVEEFDSATFQIKPVVLNSTVSK